MVETVLRLGLVSFLPRASGQPTSSPSAMPDSPAVEPLTESRRYHKLGSAEQPPMVRERQASDPIPSGARCRSRRTARIHAGHHVACQHARSSVPAVICPTCQSVGVNPGRMPVGSYLLVRSNKAQSRKSRAEDPPTPKTTTPNSAHIPSGHSREQGTKSSRNDFVVAALSEQVFSLARLGQPLKGNHPELRHFRWQGTHLD